MARVRLLPKDVVAIMSYGMWVSLSFATFLLEIKDHVVIDAPPIARYAIGWRDKRAADYFKGRGARLEAVY